jgi:Dolichyl-phosphate-mannose-protein mannosyltransferase
MSQNTREYPAGYIGLAQPVRVQFPTAPARSMLEHVIELLCRPSILLMAVTALVASQGISQGELFFHTDEMYHAMNGIFVRDFLVDFPIHYPVQYAYEYYAKYPAVALPHWPPLFYAAEGIAFLIFGVSVSVSRLVVVGFVLLAIQFWYRIAASLGPRYRAFLSALILCCLPYILMYERLTMLEIPALAMCLGAIHFWLRFLDTERGRYLWALAGFAVGGLLTSQAMIFLVFFIVLHLIAERRFRFLKRVDVWLALLASAAATLPWYMLTQRTERVPLGTMVGRVSGYGFKHLARCVTYTYYPIELYRQLGPVVLAFAGLGLILALIRWSRGNRLLAVWVLSGYACFVLISEKDPRHTILWIPAILYLALTALETLCVRRTWALIVCSAVALFFLVQALRSERPIVSGPADAASYVVSLPESAVVYYQGALHGDFIFHVRKLDPEKRHLVAREKQVVVSGHERRPILHSAREVLDFFQNWGIRYAIVEDVDPFPGFGAVRELLNSDQFELLRTFPVVTNQPDVRVRQVLVFRYRGELHPTNQKVMIPMLTLRRAIFADLSRLAGRPWPN